jgi:hypothetical protein
VKFDLPHDLYCGDQNKNNNTGGVHGWLGGEEECLQVIGVET